MALHAQKNEFESGNNPVRYLDGSTLSRPLSIPLSLRPLAALIVLVAVIIGSVALFNFSNKLITQPLEEAEATEKVLSTEINLGLPLLKDLIQLDDETIMNTFTAAGFTLYNLNATEGTAGAGFDVIKLPDGVSLIDAGILYSKGIASLSSSEAAKLLHGSWRMTIGRNGFLDMKIKYADFSSGSVEAAVKNALINEGLDVLDLGESGVDNAGNTYQMGQISVNGSTYAWQVSACPLSDKYSVEGLPASAAYVGIRMNQI